MSERRAGRRAPRFRSAGVLAASVAVIALLAGCKDREIAHGAALYQANCAVCHGPNGEGQNLARPGGSLAPEQEGWIAPALDSRGHCSSHPRSELISIVRDGSRARGSPMAGFKGKLNADQIGAIVTYLETLWDPNLQKEYRAPEKPIAPGK